jgi:hypothetical protein
MPDAGSVEAHPESIAVVLTVDNAAAPAADSLRKLRRLLLMEAGMIAKNRGLVYREDDRCPRGLLTKYSLIVTLVILQSGRNAATLRAMIAMFVKSSKRLRAP